MVLNKFLLVSLLFFSCLYVQGALVPITPSVPVSTADTIENFDDGQVNLTSWMGEDFNSSAWSLNSTVTYHNSPYSLRLYGNTWKLENIEPRQIDSGDVWQISAYIESVAEIQGFAIADSFHTLFYAFAGTEQLDPDIWITIYQGAFPVNSWNIYQLPVADDWLARFGYLPQVTGVVYINDRDIVSSGAAYFDEVLDITNDLPVAPEVTIEYSIGHVFTDQMGYRSVNVQFTSHIYDPDSEIHSYFWDFGDDSSSTLADPLHTFLVEDDHDYSVVLTVTDEAGKTGSASVKIAVDPGQSSLPVTVNFTGDIMLGRRIQSFINQNGYEQLLDPINTYLGGAADITIGNLESPLTTSTNAHPTKPILLKGSPQHAAALVYGGIDYVTLANNHILDYGLQGLQETRQVVTAINIPCFGAGKDSYEANKPVLFSKSGISFAILGSSDRTGQYNNYQPYLSAGYNKPGFADLNPAAMVQQINSVRDFSDIVILEMHSGSEYSTTPDISDPEAEYYVPVFSPVEGDRELRRFAIDNGADAVICHHPHIIHGFEVYNNKLIAHSLGNFIFDLDYPETYPSMILNASVNTSGIYKYTVTPVYIDDYITRRAKGELGLYLLDDLAAKSRAMDTYLRIHKDSITAEIVLDTTSIDGIESSTGEYVILKEKNAMAVSDPLELSRSGSISGIESIAPDADWQYRLGRQIIWWGNYEDEGCSMWNLDNADEWYDTLRRFKGERSLCQKRNAGLMAINTTLDENILIYSDTSSYTLHSYILTDNLSATGVTVQFFQTRTSTTPVGSTEISADTGSNSGWKFYSTDFIIPAQAEFLNVRLRTESPPLGTSWSWFDNTGIIEWTQWKNYSPTDEFIYPNDYYWIQIRNSSQQYSAEMVYTETSYKDHIPSISTDSVQLSPGVYTLYQNYPNPFNPVTTINFTLSSGANVNLKIFNILGQEVKTLIKDYFTAGKHSVVWDGRDNWGKNVSSGVYFYRLECAGFTSARKMILLR